MTTNAKPRYRGPAGTTLVGALASALKALPADTITDLTDALPDFDAPLPRDTTGRGNYVPDSRESPTGDDLAASGGGAERGVRVYSDTTDQGGIARLYEEFSRRLDAATSEQRKSTLHLMRKNNDLEKAVQGLAEVVAQLMGVSRSVIARAATEAPGPVQRDAETDDEEDTDDVEKSIRVGNIDLRGLMDAVAGRARQGAAPPDMTVSAMRKSRTDDLDDPYTSTEQAIARDTLAMRQAMVAAGRWPEAAIRGLPNHNPLLHR